MGRTSDARERLLAAALELFGKRGFGAVGVAEIAAHAGVQKGSFYHFFPSKEALALTAIDEHWVAQRNDWAGALAAPGTALEQLRGVFDLAAKTQADALAGVGSVTGCLFGNLALEVSSTGGALQQRLREIFDEQVSMIAAHLRAANDRGELDVADVDAAAKSIVAQIEGLILFAKLFNDPAQLDTLWQSSLRLLNAPGAVAA